MGSLFRSQEMTLCQMFLQSESAYFCISELGELGLVQFRDLNPGANAFLRNFVNDVRRCDEMERKLRFFEAEIKRDEIKIDDIDSNPEAPQPKEMIDLEITFEKLEGELKEVNVNGIALKTVYLELIEFQEVLRSTRSFFDTNERPLLDTDFMRNVLVANEVMSPAELQLGFLAGVVRQEKLVSFERMLWRVCRGNAFLKQAPIMIALEDPVTGMKVRKSVFIIFFQGEQLKSKVKKICEGFRSKLYPCPESPDERTKMLDDVKTRIKDLQTVMEQTQDHRSRVLSAASKNMTSWSIKVRKIKAIYHTLNLCNVDITHNCLIAEGWCAISDLQMIQEALRKGTERSGSSVPSILHRLETKETPPTFNKTNKFTAAFQAIVDAYGVASYQEVNPAPFTVITFPFLFAVMFGDAGHGLLMFLFGLWMVVREKSLMAQKSDNEIWNTFFGGRYIILLMGLFSIYTGLIYNDIFAKSMNIFGTSWTTTKDPDYPEITMYDPFANFTGSPYPFGIDPIWNPAKNKIPYTNSLKMKLSIVLGVMQMVFGVVLSLWNHMFFRRTINIYCEFIPQIIFLLAIFGYLVVTVFMKWLIFRTDTYCSPSLLIMLINMFMFTYNKEPCYVDQFYSYQSIVQSVLVVLAVICIPWILLTKPLILRAMHGRKTKKSRESTETLCGNMDGNDIVLGSVRSIGENHYLPRTEEADTANGTHFPAQNSASEEPGPAENSEPRKEVRIDVDNSTQQQQHASHGEEHEEEFDFGEVFIHQVIHTIEYCLGSVSHTASYLRLWALSLAHSQLSEVLWTMVFRFAIQAPPWYGCVIVYVIFAFWASLTIAVLLVMEGLSAFLHALRLHWVEFQSKFYVGEGYLFLPFSFKYILENGFSPVD